MKTLILTLILSICTFAKVTLGDNLDEWNEPNGTKYILVDSVLNKYEQNGLMMDCKVGSNIAILSSKKFRINMRPDTTITTVKIKGDNGHIITLDGLRIETVNEYNSYFIPYSEEAINIFKASTIVKIIVLDENEKEELIVFNMTGFTAKYNSALRTE
jgi:hypothetical protein